MSNPHVNHLLQLAGLPLSAGDNVEISGPDALLQTPYKFVAPGAACIAACGFGWK